jgi:NAD-dependent SIR2 family protein deacetylase
MGYMASICWALPRAHRVRLRHDGAMSVSTGVHGAVGELLAAGGLVALTGAGISTDSGIPDYRGPTGATQRRHAPMTYLEFRRDPEARHRYWARSHAGWPLMRRAQPNAGHLALAELERRGHIDGVITQNVDGLHGAAGSARVIDLHGRLDRVVCLDCGVVVDRSDVEEALVRLNGDWRPTPREHNPDGDVDLTEEEIRAFRMVSCASCGGVLKPDVVYFGENVPRPRVSDAFAWVDQAQALMVLGSSLHVFSGRRFVQRASAAGIPIVIVNQGPTRADDLAAIRMEASLSEFLTQLAGETA